VVEFCFPGLAPPCLFSPEEPGFVFDCPPESFAFIDRNSPVVDIVSTNCNCCHHINGKGCGLLFYIDTGTDAKELHFAALEIFNVFKKQDYYCFLNVDEVTQLGGGEPWSLWAPRPDKKEISSHLAGTLPQTRERRYHVELPTP
jgi:hypothetical protein